MKTVIKYFSFITLLLLINSNSSSTPLNGTYTVGAAGTYPTIDSAVSDLHSQGINGPVIFDIISGIYTESININGSIPGSSVVNTVTFKSQTGNYSDVLIPGIIIKYCSNIIVDKLSVTEDSEIGEYSHFAETNYISLANNDFQNHSLIVHFPGQFIDLIGNIYMENVALYGDERHLFSPLTDLQIKNNIINGYVTSIAVRHVNIENNKIAVGIGGVLDVDVTVSKNIIGGGIHVDGTNFYNNFIFGIVFMVNSGDFINNTVVAGTSNRAAVELRDFFNGYRGLNNIIINPEGGPSISLSLFAFPPSFSDYNVFYNGGNNNLIYCNGIYYNNVLDYSNATGYDQHSSSQPVSFVSAADLHLAESSWGDLQLVGIPDSLITDDIDGQPRNLSYPYKGADEIVDFPLPVNLVSFSSSVNDNIVQLNWTTSSETNNSGFAVERRKIINGTQWEWVTAGHIPGYGNTSEQKNYSFTEKINSGKYYYRLKQFDFNGHFEYFNLSNEVEVGIPAVYYISQNYPNPFNPTTKIDFEIPRDGRVSILLYDNSGREVAKLVNEVKPAGYYTVTFYASDLSSGVYFYSIAADKFIETKKMTYLK